MPRRSAVEQLPELLRADLNSRLVKGGFKGYVELAEWLTKQGYQISKSALGRYGQKFEERCDALKLVTEQARVIVAENPDDDNAVNEALLRLAQEKAYKVLLDMEVSPEDIDLPKLVRAIADMSRASVNQKKWQTEVREKAAAAAAGVEKIAKKGGLSDQAVADIRKQILGIAD